MEPQAPPEAFQMTKENETHPRVEASMLGIYVPHKGYLFKYNKPTEEGTNAFITPIQSVDTIETNTQKKKGYMNLIIMRTNLLSIH